MRTSWSFAAAWHRHSRRGRALLCLTAVLLMHAGLWSALSQPEPLAGSPRVKPVAKVQLRRIPISDAESGLIAAATPRRRALRDGEPSADGPAAVPDAKRPATPRVQQRADSIPARADPPAADGAALRDAESPSAAAVLPIYPTRIPPPTRLTYALQRGAASGVAVLDWQFDADGYRLQLSSAMSQGRPVDRHSQGGFDAAGLAPLRLADQQRGRDVRAANFQRERGLVSFSGPRWEWPLYPGTQDRLSWLVQLVAIAAAAPDSLREGAVLSMWVVGTRGALSAWRFEVRGRETLSVAAGDAWLLVREPEHPYDLRIELWLDPARGHWPARMRQAQVPGGEPLQWLLRDEPAAGG